jgi:hypothetical protein
LRLLFKHPVNKELLLLYRQSLFVGVSGASVGCSIDT